MCFGLPALSLDAGSRGPPLCALILMVSSATVSDVVSSIGSVDIVFGAVDLRVGSLWAVLALLLAGTASEPVIDVVSGWGRRRSEVHTVPHIGSVLSGVLRVGVYVM